MLQTLIFFPILVFEKDVREGLIDALEANEVLLIGEFSIEMQKANELQS